jgi:LCP family protein required for cell wall assembly
MVAASATLSALVAILATVGMVAVVWGQSRISVIPDEPPPAGGASARATPPAFTGRCAERSCNYLLLGSDSREGLTAEEREYTGSNEDIGGVFRSDTIVLVHVTPDDKQATFLSFPRDLWVEIPGHGYGKINSAFEGGIEGGGAQHVARTVTNLTGIRIDHVLYVDLNGFSDIVDALGGVEMCVPYPMQDELTGLDIAAGCQMFDGYTALAYVRTRHQPCDRIPDFARIARQQQFLRAVISKMLSPSQVWRLPRLVGPVLEGLRPDEGLSIAELVYLAGQLRGVSTGAADFRTVPTAPGWEGELSVVHLQPEAQRLFRRLREDRPLGDLGKTVGETPPSPAVIGSAVVDRRSLGAADDVFDVLVKGGFNTGDALGPSPLSELTGELSVKGSAILYDPGSADGEAMAEVVRGYLPNLDVMPATRHLLPEDVDVAVVIGANYQIPPPPEQGPASTVDCPPAA